MEKLYTVQEISELLRVKKAYVYTLINSKKLKAVKLSERRTRVKIEDFNEFLQTINNQVGHPSKKRETNKIRRLRA